MSNPNRPFRTLSQGLRDLEAVDPKVGEARKRFDAEVDRIAEGFRSGMDEVKRELYADSGGDYVGPL